MWREMQHDIRAKFDAIFGVKFDANCGAVCGARLFGDFLC